MEKMILRQLGNVMKFGDFCKGNERFDVEVNAPDDIYLESDQEEVLSKVGSKIEQICGWNKELLMDYIAKEYKIEKASHKDLVIWITNEVRKYYQAEINVKGEEKLPLDKKDAFVAELLDIDFGMCVEILVRKLRGMDDENKKYPPIWVKKLADLVEDVTEKVEE